MLGAWGALPQPQQRLSSTLGPCSPSGGPNAGRALSSHPSCLWCPQQVEDGAGSQAVHVTYAGDGGCEAGRTDKPDVGLGEERVCRAPIGFGGTDLSGDEGGGLSPQGAAVLPTPTHVLLCLDLQEEQLVAKRHGITFWLQ